jgi:methylmalonyl-CoA mutase N-terminal domain/subunit
MKERFGAKKPASWMLRAHSQGAGCSLTRQQPENNVVRVTIQTLAGVLGGALSLQTNSQDEAYAIPTEATVRTALRTQQIIAHESGVADFVDPLGGSYAIEALTNKVEAEAIKYMEKIDDMGGAAAAIEKGYIQSEIAESAYRYQKDIESKKQIVVGVNDFMVDEEPSINITKIDAEAEKRQIEKLKKIKSERNQQRVDQTLSKIKQAAEGRENLMPPVIDAVREYATVGEISDVLREVFGEYRE